MASIEDLAFRNADVMSNASASNALATITLTAPGKGFRWVLRSVCFSGSAAPAATVRALIKENTVVKFGLQIPAAAFAPIWCNVVGGLVFAEDGEVKVELPALGAGVTGEVTVIAYKRPV